MNANEQKNKKPNRANNEESTNQKGKKGGKSNTDFDSQPTDGRNSLADMDDE